MKFFCIVLFSLILVSCSDGKESFDQFRTLLNKNESKAIVISCIRCGCVIEDINRILRDKPEALNDYTFLADTTCTKKFVAQVNIRHVPHALMDSLSLDFYNILIIKHEQVKIIKTEESKNILHFIE